MLEVGFLEHISQHLAHSRNHRGDILEVAELLDLLNLREEIVEIELVGQYLFGETACLLLVILLLCALNERDNITHSENSVCHTLWMEHLKSIHLLTA